VPPDLPEPIVVQPDFSALTVGAHRALLTVLLDDGTHAEVAILSVVAPAGTPVNDALTGGDRVSRATASPACSPKMLLPQFTAAGFTSNLVLGYPAFIAATVVDDCGVPLTSGSVIATFSNGILPWRSTTFRGAIGQTHGCQPCGEQRNN